MKFNDIWLGKSKQISIKRDELNMALYLKSIAWLNGFLTYSILKGSAIYLLWITLHYAASHLYVTMCTHSSVYGFILSPLIIDTPCCSSIRWIIYNGAYQIRLMWAFFGGYIVNGLEKIWL